MSGLRALILGATGATGSLLLQDLLASPCYSSVGEFGRRITPQEKIVNGKEKLQQHIVDFDDLDDSAIKDGTWDVVFIAIGTTIFLAKDAAEFERVNVEYVVKAARLARSKPPAVRKQRLIFISTVLADMSSHLRYFRTKARAELALAQLGYEELIILRPGAFGKVHREVPRPFEVISGYSQSLLQGSILCLLMLDPGIHGREVYENCWRVRASKSPF